MPGVGTYKGREQKPMSDWVEALFASQGVIGIAATQSCNILVSYQFSSSGSQVLQDLICLHHPGHRDTQAISFLSVKGATPLMLVHVTAGDQLGTLTFGNWEAHLKLYPDSKYIHETEYHFLFLAGLTPALHNQVQQEKNDLLVFQHDAYSSYILRHPLPYTSLLEVF
jgi:hypothetical protein